MFMQLMSLKNVPPTDLLSSASMTTRKARFHTLEAVIDDDDKHYRHTPTNNNADFAKAVERAFR